MKEIEEAIEHISWQNDKGNSSDDARMIALLEALNCIADQQERIANALVNLAKESTLK